MTIDVLQRFFLWCVMLNGGLLILSSLILICAGDFVYRVHSRWFPMSRETFSAVIYSFLGLFKMFVLMFNLVPYIALRMVG